MVYELKMFSNNFSLTWSIITVDFLQFFFCFFSLFLLNWVVGYGQAFFFFTSVEDLWEGCNLLVVCRMMGELRFLKKVWPYGQEVCISLQMELILSRIFKPLDLCTWKFITHQFSMYILKKNKLWKYISSLLLYIKGDWRSSLMVQLLVFILYNVLLIVRFCPCFLDDLLYKIWDFLALTHPNKTAYLL